MPIERYLVNGAVNLLSGGLVLHSIYNISQQENYELAVFELIATVGFQVTKYLDNQGREIIDKTLPLRVEKAIRKSNRISEKTSKIFDKLINN